jgi:integrase
MCFFVNRTKVRKSTKTTNKKVAQRIYEKAKEKVGIEDFRFHDLRHTAASLFASGGCDIMSLENLLVHKPIRMTQQYAHLMPEAHERTRRIINDFRMSSDSDTKETTQENE